MKRPADSTDRSPKSLEHWLHSEVMAAYEEIKADPAAVRTSEQVRARLLAKYQAALDKPKR